MSSSGAQQRDAWLLTAAITQLHPLHDGWEYVLECRGPTAAYDQRRAVAKSLELVRT